VVVVVVRLRWVGWCTREVQVWMTAGRDLAAAPLRGLVRCDTGTPHSGGCVSRTTTRHDSNKCAFDLE
jgi:hypothetical protein